MTRTYIVAGVAAYLVLLVANLVFSTGYAVTRVVLNDVGPATLGLARVLIGAVLLLGWAAWRSSSGPRVPARVPWTTGDRVRVALMGVSRRAAPIAPALRPVIGQSKATDGPARGKVSAGGPQRGCCISPRIGEDRSV